MALSIKTCRFQLRIFSKDRCAYVAKGRFSSLPNRDFPGKRKGRRGELSPLSVPSIDIPDTRIKPYCGPRITEQFSHGTQPRTRPTRVRKGKGRQEVAPQCGNLLIHGFQNYHVFMGSDWFKVTCDVLNDRTECGIDAPRGPERKRAFSACERKIFHTAILEEHVDREIYESETH